MKRMAIEDLSVKVDTLIRAAPKDTILLTRNGQPFAFVSDASKYDWEGIGYMIDPEFWKMIRERRREKGGIPIEQIRAELEEAERRAANRAKANKSRRSRARQSRSAA